MSLFPQLLWDVSARCCLGHFHSKPHLQHPKTRMEGIWGTQIAIAPLDLFQADVSLLPSKSICAEGKDRSVGTWAFAQHLRSNPCLHRQPYPREFDSDLSELSRQAPNALSPLFCAAVSAFLTYSAVANAWAKPDSGSAAHDSGPGPGRFAYADPTLKAS